MIFGFKNSNGRFDRKYDSLPYYQISSFSYAMVFVLIANLIASIVVTINPTIQDAVWFFYLRYFLVSLSLFLGFFVVYKRQKLLFKEDVSSLKCSPIFYALIPLIFFGTFFGLSFVNDLFIDFLGIFGYNQIPTVLPEKTPLNVALSIVFICLIPAVVEELLFRGVLINGLKNMGNLWAVMLSGLLFSLYHTSPAQTIYQFIIGVIYGVVALHSQSVIPTIILHFFNNFVIVILNYYFPTFAITGALQIIFIVSGIAAIIISIIIILKKFKLEAKSEKPTKDTYWQVFSLLFAGIVICLVLWIFSLVSGFGG